MSEKGKHPSNRLVREYMITALMQLLREKPLSAISVSELAARAGVSRMTYYRNYACKEDIFASYLQDLIDDYRETAQQLTLTGDYYEQERLVHCFSYFKTYQDFLGSLFQSGLGHIFLKGLSDYMMETWQKPGDSLDRRYTLQAFAGSLYHLYICWTFQGGRETPEQMAAILHRIYAPVADQRA